MGDHTSSNHTNDDDVTQGENPGAQGDFGAGQGEPGVNDPITGDGDVIEGDEQPRRADPVADDIGERNPDSGDIVAGEQVLDEGQVSPHQDDVGAHDEGNATGTDDPSATPDDLEHAADERTDAGAAPIDPETL